MHNIHRMSRQLELLDALEKALCVASYQLVTATLTAQAPGQAIQLWASGDVVAGAAKGSPSNYTVSFLVAPLTGFLQ